MRKKLRRFQLVDFDRMISREHKKSYPWTKLWGDLFEDPRFKNLSNDAQLFYFKLIPISARSLNEMVLNCNDVLQISGFRRMDKVEKLIVELKENQLLIELSDASESRLPRELLDKIRKDSSRVDSITSRKLENFGSKIKPGHEQIQEAISKGILKRATPPLALSGQGVAGEV